MTATTTSPTLATIRMVEQTLKEPKASPLTLAGLKRLLPRQVHHATLKAVLAYLEESNKIVYTGKGMVWIHNTNPLLQKAIEKGIPWAGIGNASKRNI